MVTSVVENGCLDILSFKERNKCSATKEDFFMKQVNLSQSDNQNTTDLISECCMNHYNVIFADNTSVDEMCFL